MEKNSFVDADVDVDADNIIYRKDIDPSRFLQREVSFHILDLRAPMTMFDKRIEPVYIIELVNNDTNDPMFGDRITLYVYDPNFADNFMMTKEVYKEAVALKKKIKPPVFTKKQQPIVTKAQAIEQEKPIVTEAEAIEPEIKVKGLDRLRTTLLVGIRISSVDKKSDQNLSKAAYDGFVGRLSDTTTDPKEKNRDRYKGNKLYFDHTTQVLELKKD